MADTDSRKGKRNGVSRRSSVKTAGASGVAVGLAGCISTGGGDGDNDDNGSNGGGDSNTSTPINTEEATEDITVKIADDIRMADNSDAIVQSMRNAELPDNTSIDIIAGSQMIDNCQAQYQQRLGDGREEPTLLMMDSGWTIPFIARNQLQSLSESLSSEMISTIKDKYFEASVSAAKGSSGDLYDVSLLPGFPTMQYRKDLLRNAGYIDDDFDTRVTESMSWEEFLKVTKEVLNVDDVQYGYTLQADAYEGLPCCDFNESMTSYGGAFFGGRGNFFGPVGERPIMVDEQLVLDSIRMVRTFIHDEDDEYTSGGITGGITPEAVLQWTEEPSRKSFTGGDTIMHRDWSYSIIINGADDVFGGDPSVMSVPYGVPADEVKYEGTGDPVAVLGGWHMTMNPNAPQQQKQAGAQVLEVMMKPQFQLDDLGIQGWILPRSKLLDSKETKNVDVIGRYLSALKVAGNNATPRPVTVMWPQQSGKAAQEVNSAYAQEKTPGQAMSDLKSQLEAVEQSLA